MIAAIPLVSGCALNSEVYQRTEIGYYYGKGLTNISEGEYEKAIGYLNEGLKDYSNSGLYTLRGFAFCKSGKFKQAVDDFSLALKYKQTEDFSIASINRHLSRTAYYKDAFIYANRGLAFSYIKDEDRTESAIEDLDSACNMEPKKPIWLCYRALAKINFGETDDAIKDLNEAIRLNRKSPIPYHIRRKLWESLDDKERASQDKEVEEELDYNKLKDETNYNVI